MMDVIASGAKQSLRFKPEIATASFLSQNGDFEGLVQKKLKNLPFSQV
jgi:hypothetical protein